MMHRPGRQMRKRQGDHGCRHGASGQFHRILMGKSWASKHHLCRRCKAD
jgi:hypothetical protein